MKVALIIPGNIWFAPYVRNYTRILDILHINYQIISWNRDGKDNKEGIQFDLHIDANNGSASLSDYLKYVRFIKQTIKKERFDRLIVLGPQIACLLGSYLLSHYRSRYIIDYRDLSIEQKPGFKQLFALLTKKSFANVVSSPGFIRCLPQRKYYLSHNFDVEIVNKALSTRESEHFNSHSIIDVLTIGGIRDYSSNVQIIDALANDPNYTVRFVGRGNDALKLSEHCERNGIKNVFFRGFYNKPEEAGFINKATFLNIFYPRIITHDTALSNRFYNSLIFKKPMIVTRHTCQGDYAEKYNVGVALVDCNNIKEELSKFIQQDYNNYADRCDKLLKEFLLDQQEFETIVKQFVSESN